MIQLCGHRLPYAECGMIADAGQYNKHVGCVRSRVKTMFGVSEINAGWNHLLHFSYQSLSQGKSLELVAGSGIGRFKPGIIGRDLLSTPGTYR